jgi:flagellar basal-body rod protein FlgG
MNGAFYIGATGLGSQQRALEVVANNIANMNTVGFKRSSVRFSELVSGWAADPTLAPAAVQGQSGLAGVSLSGSSRVLEQGELRPTGEAMDLAINGEGFVELLGPNGASLLWRGGTLAVDREGLLTGAGGLPLKAMITVPDGATELRIAGDGKVTATVAGQAVVLGQIDLARPGDTARLALLGEGLYEAAADDDLRASAPGEDGAGLLAQGSLESANVQLTDEMVMLMLLQRSYAANAQVVQAGDQMMAIANGLKR